MGAIMTLMKIWNGASSLLCEETICGKVCVHMMWLSELNSCTSAFLRLYTNSGFFSETALVS